jgi:hypothetical protein
MGSFRKIPRSVPEWLRFAKKGYRDITLEVLRQVSQKLPE